MDGDILKTRSKNGGRSARDVIVSIAHGREDTKHLKGVQMTRERMMNRAREYCEEHGIDWKDEAA